MHRHRQMHRTCPGAQWYPVPEGECDMRVPQVSERIKEAPAQALRGVFAGIGQLLLVTDKLRNKAPARHDAPQAAPEPPRAAEPPQAPEPVHVPEPSAEAPAEAQRDLDKTGNVRLLTEEAPEPVAAEAPAAAEPAAAEPAAAGAA